jgi:hypothetical protein
MRCDKCGSTAITYYKQRRKDGVIVVTARCENDHHPITGKPFYPISQFDIASLPMLGEKAAPQIEMFTMPAETQEPDVDIIAQKRRIFNSFTSRFPRSNS